MATNWVFIPAFDNNPDMTTAGCNRRRRHTGAGLLSALVAHCRIHGSATYFNDQATTHDFAFAVVGMGGKSGDCRRLDECRGWLRHSTSNVGGSQRLSAFGYPAAGKYNGLDLDLLLRVPDRGPDNTTTGDDRGAWRATMTGGSSGGPWLIAGSRQCLTLDAAGDGGSIGSLNSYGYSGVSIHVRPEVSTPSAKAVWDAASALVEVCNTSPTGRWSRLTASATAPPPRQRPVRPYAQREPRKPVSEDRCSFFIRARCPAGRCGLERHARPEGRSGSPGQGWT